LLIGVSESLIVVGVACAIDVDADGVAAWAEVAADLFAAATALLRLLLAFGV